MKEEPPEQQEWSSSLQQEDSEPPHIKEEQEELWSSQEGGEQLQEWDEVDSSSFPFTVVTVTGEEEEERPDPEMDLDPGIQVKVEDSSEAETEDSEEWEESREQSGVSDERTNAEEGLESEFGETLRTKRRRRRRDGEKLFSCSFCGRMFNNKGNLTRHTRVHTVGKPFSCPECGKGFTQKSNLTLHLAQHRGKPYGCSECQESFPYYSLLVTHSRKHRGLKRFICSVCGKEWRSSSKLKTHLKVHTAEKPYSCSDCGARYSNLYQVNRHWCVKRSEQLIKTGFQSQDEAESEPEEDSGPDPDPGEETNPSVGPEDGGKGEFWEKSRKLRSAVTYQRKQKVSGDDERHPESKPSPFKDHVAPSEPETHQADQIDLWTQSKPPTDLDPLQDEDLCETGAGIHQDPSEGSSSQGGTGPETGSGFERLLTEYTSEKQRPDVCESSDPPQTQTGTPLTAKRLLSCPQCGGGFIEEQDLLVHMRIHIKEHLFSCSVCGQRFANRDSLTAHVLSHAVGEPFCCSACDAGFPLSQSECEHLRGAPEQTRFHCSCGEEFTWRRHLIRHMEGHKPGHTEFTHYSCSRDPQTGLQTGPQTEPETTDREETSSDSRGHESETLVSNMKHVLQSSDVHGLLKTSQDHQEAPRAEQNPDHLRVIKEEPEEVWIGQTEATKFTFAPVSVKSEEEEEDPVSGHGSLSKTSVWDREASERQEPKSEDSVDSDFWKEGEAQRKSLLNEEAPRSSKGNKIYICFKCGGRFHVLGDLRSHEKRVHRMKEKKKRTFPCSVCGHVCPYLSHLKIHMRRHTGEKPFVCQKCGKKYAQKENLRLHMLKHARESTPTSDGFTLNMSRT